MQDMQDKPNWLRPYPGYLFDLDGTLVDTAPDISTALNIALEQAGHQPVSEAHTRHWVGHGARVLLEQALDHQHKPHDSVDVMFETFIAHYRDHIADRSKPYPGVVESLSALRTRGAKLGVVTNKLTTLANAVLEALALMPFFDIVVCGDTTDAPKPSSTPVTYACGQLGLDVGEVLFVGDSQTDVDCARAAGCTVVCVPDGYNHGTPASALGADGVIESFGDLV